MLRDQQIILPNVASQAGISTRATQTNVNDLVAGGYIERTRVGRRNRYVARLEQPLRHKLHAAAALQAIIEPLLAPQVTPPQMLSPFHGLAEQSRTALQRSRGTIEASRNLVRRASGERPLATFTRAGEKTA